MSGEASRKERMRRVLDATSFGVFLIIVGLVFALSPGFLGSLGDFFRSFATYNGPPPYSAFPAVYDAFFNFLSLMGVWSLVLAGIRLVVGLGWLSGVGSALGGIFLLIVGYYGRQLAQVGVSAWTVIAFIVIVGGILLIVNGLAKHFLGSRP